MEGACISGQVRSRIHTRDNLKEEKEMEGAHFGGLMEVGTKVSLRRDFKVEKEFCSETGDIKNLKVSGTMGCLMVREFNTSRMDKGTKEPLKRTNFTEMEYFTNRIR